MLPRFIDMAGIVIINIYDKRLTYTPVSYTHLTDQVSKKMADSRRIFNSKWDNPGYVSQEYEKDVYKRQISCVCDQVI